MYMHVCLTYKNYYQVDEGQESFARQQEVSPFAGEILIPIIIEI